MRLIHGVLAHRKLVELDCDEGAVRVETTPRMSEDLGSESASRLPGGFDAVVRLVLTS